MRTPNEVARLTEWLGPDNLCLAEADDVIDAVIRLAELRPHEDIAFLDAVAARNLRYRYGPDVAPLFLGRVEDWDLDAIRGLSAQAPLPFRETAALYLLDVTADLDTDCDVAAQLLRSGDLEGLILLRNARMARCVERPATPLGAAWQLAAALIDAAVGDERSVDARPVVLDLGRQASGRDFDVDALFEELIAEHASADAGDRLTFVASDAFASLTLDTPDLAAETKQAARDAHQTTRSLGRRPRTPDSDEDRPSLPPVSGRSEPAAPPSAGAPGLPPAIGSTGTAADSRLPAAGGRDVEKPE